MIQHVLKIKQWNTGFKFNAKSNDNNYLNVITARKMYVNYIEW